MVIWAYDGPNAMVWSGNYPARALNRYQPCTHYSIYSYGHMAIWSYSYMGIWAYDGIPIRYGIVWYGKYPAAVLNMSQPCTHYTIHSWAYDHMGMHMAYGLAQTAIWHIPISIV